jgi:hypothetical protein
MLDMKPLCHTASFRPLAAAGLLVLACAPLASAHAWTLSIASASRRVFLSVGNGSQLVDNGIINLVSVTLTGTQLLGGTPQAMTSNSTQSASPQDGFAGVCPTPASQILVSASYRRSNTTTTDLGSATLRVTSPVNLVNAAGDTIPFSQISWTVAAPGSPDPTTIPGGAFSGAAQTLATITANTFRENCHSFVYANSAIRAAGTYTGQVTYTLTSP